MIGKSIASLSPGVGAERAGLGLRIPHAEVPEDPFADTCIVDEGDDVQR